MVDDKLTDISDICSRFNITSRTLRFYEEEGLISSTRIGNTGRRKYSHEQIDRIREILTLRTIGISVTEIKEYLDGNVSLKEVVHLRKAEITASVERKMSEIKMLNETLMALEDGENVFNKKPASSHTKITELFDISKQCAKYLVYKEPEKIYTFFSKTMTEYLPLDSLKAVWRDSIDGIGDFVEIGKTFVSQEGNNIILQDIIFSKATVRLKFVFHNNIIHGFWQSYIDRKG